MSLFGGILDAVGGFLGHGAQKKAAGNVIQSYKDAQAGATTAFTGARDASLGYYQPYAQGGQQAFGNALNMQSGGFQYSPSDPSYQWRLDQGVNALDRSASAQGAMNSGGTLKALTRYGQGLASTEFQNDFARNNTLAGYGMQAAQGQAQAQNNYATGTANALFSAANGQRLAYGDKGDAKASQFGDIANGIQSVGKYFGF